MNESYKDKKTIAVESTAPEQLPPFNYESKVYQEDLMDQESGSIEDEFSKYEEENSKVSAKVSKPELAKPDYSRPPKLELADMLNEEGEIIDFSQAQTYHDLIEMITREGKIKNQLGQELPAEKVINLIYKLTYQDLKNYQKEDWTNITLRHRLRETVAKLINEYKKTEEFKALVGLDLSQATTVEEVINLIKRKERLIDAQGNYVNSEVIIGHIKEGHLHLLPELIRFKIIELNRIKNEEYISQSSSASSDPQAGKSFFGRLGNVFSKLKFWQR